MFHFHVVQTKIGNGLSRRVPFAGIAMVHDVSRIDKTETLANDITQVGFRQVVIQPGHHTG